MGKCIYCEKKAGFLSSRHRACKTKFENGVQLYIDEISNTIVKKSTYENLKQKLEEIRVSHLIKENQKPSLIALGFDRAIKSILSDRLLSVEEEDRVTEFKTRFELSEKLLDKNGSYTKVIMSSILRDLSIGLIPELNTNNVIPLPFLFQKSEQLIWFFNDVGYYEQQTRTEYHGSKGSLNFELFKGVDYEMSSFSVSPVSITEMNYISTGTLAITTNHIYFGSDDTTFKIRHSNLIGIDPYEDGIGIHTDGWNSVPQVFNNIDGWFMYYAIIGLNKL